MAKKISKTFEPAVLILKENEAYAIRSDYVLEKLKAGFHIVIDYDLSLFQRLWKYCSKKGLALERYEINDKTQIILSVKGLRPRPRAAVRAVH